VIEDFLFLEGFSLLLTNAEREKAGQTVRREKRKTGEERATVGQE